MPVHSSISRSNFTVDDTCDLPQARASDQLQNPSSTHPLAALLSFPAAATDADPAVLPAGAERPYDDGSGLPQLAAVGRAAEMERAHDISNSRSDGRLPSVYGTMETNRRKDEWTVALRVPSRFVLCYHANRPNESLLVLLAAIQSRCIVRVAGRRSTATMAKYICDGLFPSICPMHATDRPTGRAD